MTLYPSFFNGQTTDTEEVKAYIGNSFHTAFNSIYAQNDVSMASIWDSNSDTEFHIDIVDDDESDSPNTTACLFPFQGYMLGNCYDNFDYSGYPNATEWTYVEPNPGYINVTGGYLHVQMHQAYFPVDALVTSDGSSGFDAKVSDCTIVVDMLHYAVGASGSFGIELYDGTNFVTVKVATTTRTLSEIYIDVSAETFILRSKTSKTGSWGSWAAPVSLASLTGSNWYIRFFGKITNPATSSGTMRVYACDVAQTSASVDTEFTITPNLSTVNALLVDYNVQLNGGSISIEGSANGGTDYDSLELDVLKDMTVAGSSVKVKFSTTTVADKPLWLTNWGALMKE